MRAVRSAKFLSSHRRRVRVILQARTTSSRQPAKSLLPLGGVPLAILCAKRLSGDDLEVVLATSVDPSDDVLAGIAARAGVHVFRGDLTDVLARFVACAADLADDDIVVRMTADNPVPDVDLVRRLVAAFVEQDASYLTTRWPDDGLPYGVGGEVFTVAALRRAAGATTFYEREHVTPFMVAHERVGILGPGGLGVDGDYSRARCTIDTLDDFVGMARVFEKVSDPVTAAWQDLVALSPPDLNASGLDVSRVAINPEPRGRIVLGTAQFGMHYGVTNRSGYPSDAELQAILCAAKASGLTQIDTARGYGNAEARLGVESAAGHLDGIQIISKVEPLWALHRRAGTCAVAAAVDASVFRSCYALQRRRIDVMMFHRFNDMVGWDGAALDRLHALVDEGVIGAVGVSVYTPAEAIRGLADDRVTHLQIPFNLLDHRWLADDFLAAVRARPAVTIHVRSVFLQGLLINPAGVWPAWFQRAEEFVVKIAELSRELGRISPADLCMAYVRGFPWVGTLVVGVDCVQQFTELAAVSSNPSLRPEELKLVQSAFRSAPRRLLNPSKWS